MSSWKEVMETRTKVRLWRFRRPWALEKPDWVQGPMPAMAFHKGDGGVGSSIRERGTVEGRACGWRKERVRS